MAVTVYGTVASPSVCTSLPSPLIAAFLKGTYGAGHRISHLASADTPSIFSFKFDSLVTARRTYCTLPVVSFLEDVIGSAADSELSELHRSVEIKVTAALTREIAEDPCKRAGDSFNNYKLFQLAASEIASDGLDILTRRALVE
ncbi:hypothetical protein DFH08DRAFT_807239 [Mycena albidolilacea]|uniref:Uncharacterized protein n=1 Tax=Mycena albidolilacea TaxID=1033008 RepID=A0AAD7A5E2_9AGAR|nr:hypothetical protein DFH08DRAFT_807239 [Mycena albidolilacea]